MKREEKGERRKAKMSKGTTDAIAILVSLGETKEGIFEALQEDKMDWENFTVEDVADVI